MSYLRMNREYVLRASFNRIVCRCCVILIALFGALISSTSTETFAQNASSSKLDAITVQGTVRDSSGKPIPDVHVVFTGKEDSVRFEAKTNTDGNFLLSVTQAGTYAIRAEKSDWQNAVIDSCVVKPGERKQIDLVLQRPDANTATSKLEFSDEPSFTVAGVTDWSNLGLHGSDTTSKASEALAKDTLALKSTITEPNSTGVDPEKVAGRDTMSPAAMENLKKSRERVLQDLTKSNTAANHHLLADIDEQLDNPLEAVQAYERAARLDPSEQNYFDWGTELLLHRAAKPAAEVFTKGSSTHPNSSRILAGLGAALYADGSYEEAAKRLCEASDRKPADPTPYLFLGKMELTIPALLPCSEQKLARFAGQQPQNAFANYYYSVSIWKRARSSENTQDSKKAEALLEKAVTLNPKLDEALLQLGNMYLARNAFSEAISAYQKAINANPHLAEAHYRLSLAYKRTGETVKAEQEFLTYKQAQKEETAEMERQRRDLRQFLVILKDQPAASTP